MKLSLASAVRSVPLLVSALGLLLFLAAGARAQDRRVLVIGIDGVRVDILAASNTPNLDGLIAAGAFTDSARTGLRIEGEVRIEDVAATALAYLGVRAELDGRPRGISPR